MTNNTIIKKSLPDYTLKKKKKRNQNENISYRNCNSILYMVSLYKERRKCMVKLPTMQHSH